MQNTVTVPTKAFYESKTLIFNVLSILVLIVGVLLDSSKALAIPDQAAAWLAAVVAIGNGLLRFITTSPISSGANQTTDVPATNPPGGGQG